ncbi:hypothetical protein HP548_23680 [Paenibacillus taichungensis]|uniref:Uncharacterized protein n=1 Tax=Paenibacillus taichungensis TaxID=484184 RepID=A0ABX2MSL4_9BACL|nr:hypothetical protein [Paenibacillus taichungensis]NUU57086.1 hypothetical protein [Paenibacillus taichungensis]
MESRMLWVFQNRKFIWGILSLLFLVASTLTFFSTASSEKITQDERIAALNEYYNNCQYNYCQDKSMRELVKLHAQAQEYVLYFLKLAIVDPRLSTSESILASSVEHEIEKNIKKYTLLGNDEEAKKIVAGTNSTMNLTLLYDGEVLKFDPMKIDTFMYTLDQEIASYNSATSQLTTKGKGKTTLVVVDGLYRKEFEIAVK